MKINSENIDEILFEYFEGNLSIADKELVKIFLDQHPEHISDFRLWEVSNVKHLPLEEAADKNLLKSINSTGPKNWLFVWSISIVVTFLFLYNHTQKNLSKNISTVSVAKKAEAHERINTRMINNFNFNTSEKSAKNSSNPSAKTFIDTAFDRKSSSEDSLVTIIESKKIIPVISSDTVMVPELEKKKSSSIMVKKISRKEERKLARELMKRKQKEYDRRQQEKLIKGRKPYVVPIYPNGF
jgi:hypothetical protein